MMKIIIFFFGVGDVSGSKANPGSTVREKYLDKGTYILKFSSAAGAVSDAYDIKASFASVKNNDVEPNNVFSNANPLHVGSNYTSVIGVGDEHDWYKINITDETDYILYMQTYGLVFYTLHGRMPGNTTICQNSFTHGFLADGIW